MANNLRFSFLLAKIFEIAIHKSDGDFVGLRLKALDILRNTQFGLNFKSISKRSLKSLKIII